MNHQKTFMLVRRVAHQVVETVSIAILWVAVESPSSGLSYQIVAFAMAVAVGRSEAQVKKDDAVTELGQQKLSQTFFANNASRARLDKKY